jgi:hypothetical protein
MSEFCRDPEVGGWLLILLRSPTLLCFDTCFFHTYKHTTQHNTTQKTKNTSEGTHILPVVKAKMTSNLVEETMAVISAAIGGARYGVKIRMPHALIMTLVFRHDLSSSEKVATILKLTRNHALSLATFAAIYKVQI